MILIVYPIGNRDLCLALGPGGRHGSCSELPQGGLLYVAILNTSGGRKTCQPIKRA